MLLRNILSLFFMAALAIFSIFTLPSQAEAGRYWKKVCKQSTVRAAGALRTDRALAKLSAKIYWSGKAKRRYFRRYMAWPVARNKKVECRLRRKARYYRCVVSAKPCTLVRRRR